MNKTTVRLFLTILILTLLVCLCSGCVKRDDASIVGRWRMLSYTTDDGLSYQVDQSEHLEMTFFANANGEATANGVIQYPFAYTARGGVLERTIYRASGEQIVQEKYHFSEDGSTLTVYSPDEGATIVLSRVTE